MKYLSILMIAVAFITSCDQISRLSSGSVAVQTLPATSTARSSQPTMFSSTTTSTPIVSSTIIPSSVTTFTPSPDKLLKFSGEISRGQTFEQQISQNLVFRLEPLEHDWVIWIGDKTQPDKDYSGVVTPPYYGMNARYLEGWHFRNIDNSGPNEAGEKNVNAPQKARNFYFVLNEMDYQIAYDALNTRLLSSDEEKEQALEKRKQLKLREGILTITNLELGNLTLDEKAWIDYMEFEVELNLPSDLDN